MENWAIAEHNAGEEEASSSSSASSSSEDEEEEVVNVSRERGNVDAATSSNPPALPAESRPKITIKLRGQKSDTQASSKAVCHVCGEAGHFSGFVGATYIDCINKPCYLCGESGHSTATCPHRFAPEAACSSASDVLRGSLFSHVIKREREPSLAGWLSVAPISQRWEIRSAVLKLHSRRVTCLEFHPTNDKIVLSGDKRGQIAVWDLDGAFERTVYGDINQWLTNSLKFLPGGWSNGATCVSASYDGTVKLFDVEVGVVMQTMYNANPRGWEHVVEEDAAGNWVSFLGLDAAPCPGSGGGLVVAGDSKGRVYLLDPRAQGATAILQACKKNTKVQSIHINPVDNSVLLVAGNDHQARLLDIKYMHGGSNVNGPLDSPCSVLPAGRDVSELACFPHNRVINAAYFSPLSGRKIMTTSQDNRLRVWDNWPTALSSTPPDREIVHSHTFNRHLTAFKAEWDPKDVSERTIVIGRYISEDFGGVALHPIDIMDAATGSLVRALADPNLTTISPVNKPHPTRDVIVSGSSRSLYAWKPALEEEEEDDEIGLKERGESSNHGMTAFRPTGSSHLLQFDADQGQKTKKKATKKPSGTKRQRPKSASDSDSD
jgi:DNA damage-binding protein 2